LVVVAVALIIMTVAKVALQDLIVITPQVAVRVVGQQALASHQQVHQVHLVEVVALTVPEMVALVWPH
jgi:hypothetical protein